MRPVLKPGPVPAPTHPRIRHLHQPRKLAQQQLRPGNFLIRQQKCHVQGSAWQKVMIRLALLLVKTSAIFVLVATLAVAVLGLTGCKMAFTGVLNANNGIYWYTNGPESINFKLDGRCPQSLSPGLVFNIAGYQYAITNTIRTVSPLFSAAHLLIRAAHFPEIRTEADVRKRFTGPNQISFATTYNVMGGPNAVKIANNLTAGLFFVDDLHAT